jgi:hypothetical protein
VRSLGTGQTEQSAISAIGQFLLLASGSLRVNPRA